MTNFDIKIVSDTVCPWCYIGKKRLEKAIALYQKTYPSGSADSFSITWLPYYLDPTAPRESVPLRDRFIERFGADQVDQMQARVKHLGEPEGIHFKYGGRIGNTRDSHRLIQLGKTKSSAIQTRIVEELFRAYFEEERDITSHDVLINAGVAAGLERKEVKEWLDADGGGAEVDREVEQAVKAGIRGVPHFTIQNRHHVDGAQDPSAFLEVFATIKEE